MKTIQVTLLINEDLIAKMQKIAPRKSLEFNDLLRDYIALGLYFDAPILEDDYNHCDTVINRHRRMRDDETS